MGQFDGQGDHPPCLRGASLSQIPRCGIFAHGFARARCFDCGHDYFVAFSCKGRGVCPSCNTRRRAEIAAHLADHVFPRLPTRQWVLSVPKRLRYFMQRDGAALNTALRVFLRIIQRTEPAKRLPAHYHCAVLIARIYEMFLLACPIRAGQMRIIAFIIDGQEVPKILAHIGVDPRLHASPRRVGHRCGMRVKRRRERVWRSSPIGTYQPKLHPTTRSISAQVGEMVGG